MAILTDEEHRRFQNRIAPEVGTVAYDANQMKAATQAVEDWFEANRPSLNTAINAATAPLVLNAQTKKFLVCRYIERKGQREAEEP